MRELVSLAGGNELRMSVFLAVWMILNGLGAHLATLTSTLWFDKYKILTWNVWLVFPLASFFLMHALFETSSLPGLLVSDITVALIVCVCLMPICVLTGMLFYYYAGKFIHIDKPGGFGRAYSFEVMGGVFGGLMYTLWLASLTAAFKVLVLVACCGLGIGIWQFRNAHWWCKIVHFIFGTSLLCGAMLYPFDTYFFIKQHRGQEHVATLNSKYGSVILSQSHGQHQIYVNGKTWYQSNNIESTEERVHFAMLQRKDIGAIAVVYGATPDILAELFKYRVSDIDVLAFTPEVFDFNRRLTISDLVYDINVYYTDPRFYFKVCSQKYDVVLLNFPEPSSLSVNRLYTQEFFWEVKKCMSEEGVLMCSMPAVGNYIDQASGRLHSVLFATLKRVYANVMVLPGSADYFLASDGVLSDQIVLQATEYGITNHFVNRYYLDDVLLHQRRLAIEGILDTTAQINSDYFPRMMLSGITSFSDRFNLHWGIVVLGIVLMVLVVLLFIPADYYSVFAMSFTAMGLQIILLFYYQLKAGSLMLDMGILFASFMAGMGLMMRVRNVKLYSSAKKLWALLLFYVEVILLLVLCDFTFHNRAFSLLCMSLIQLCTGGILGAYIKSTAIGKGNTTGGMSNIYVSDLLGASMGGMLVALLVLPLAGVVGTLMLLLLLALLGLLMGK